MLNKRYKLLDQVGRGGMASVYKAQDFTLGRTVAIKLLHPGLTHDSEFLKRFRHEAHAVANLSHPNIVTLHDIGQDGEHHYIVMEFVEGQTLKDLIKRAMEHQVPIPFNQALDILIQVSAGIGYAHRSGLVHCDVKPQNILVTSDMRVKVADFGIARAVSESSQEIQNIVWGTPQYLSPEQAAGKVPTPASDVYSIGIILYEILTNQLPFVADTPAALALQHLQAEPTPIRQLNNQIPPTIAEIAHKLLSKEATGRYRTAGQLERVLETYRNSNQLMTKPKPPARIQKVAPSMPIYEQKTVFADTTGRRPKTKPTRRTKTNKPHTMPLTKQRKDEGDTQPLYLSVEAQTDWAGIVLGLVALGMLLGLIPLWWLVYQQWVA